MVFDGFFGVIFNLIFDMYESIAGYLLMIPDISGLEFMNNNIDLYLFSDNLILSLTYIDILSGIIFFVIFIMITRLFYFVVKKILLIPLKLVRL